MNDPTQVAVPAGVALLFMERLYSLFKNRNGSAPVGSDRVRLIVQEEIEPIRKSLHRIETAVEVLRATKSKGASA